MLRTKRSMAKQHVRCWRASGPMADITKSTQLTPRRHSTQLPRRSLYLFHRLGGFASPGKGEHPPLPRADGLEALRGALANERRRRKAAEIELAKLRQQHVSDDEKAL